MGRDCTKVLACESIRQKSRNSGLHTKVAVPLKRWRGSIWRDLYPGIGSCDDASVYVKDLNYLILLIIVDSTLLHTLSWGNTVDDYWNSLISHVQNEHDEPSLEGNKLAYESLPMPLLDWSINVNNQQHSDRIIFMRSISYEIPAWPENERYESQQGRALSLNVSSGGILLLIDIALDVHQVLKIFVPSVLDVAQTPTLGEVRWTRPVPFDVTDRLFFVGLKFVL
jgi:hypothetical protein